MRYTIMCVLKRYLQEKIHSLLGMNRGLYIFEQN